MKPKCKIYSFAKAVAKKQQREALRLLILSDKNLFTVRVGNGYRRVALDLYPTNPITQ